MTGLVPPACPAGSGLMRIGELSRRSGTPVRALRAYTDQGLVYSAGRSAAGYRLFDDSALWCTAVIRELRGLGLTIAEIRELAAVCLGQPDQPIWPHLARLLGRSPARAGARIADLQNLRRRIDAILTGPDHESAGMALRTADPRRAASAGPSGQQHSLRATGPLGHLVNLAIFAAFYATPWYAPSLALTSDAALLFYGASMLLAAVRGYAGCEVLAVPNWLLRRDYLERR